MKEWKMFLVKFKNPFPKGHKDYDSYPFKEGEVVLFMGEIEYMPGHCVVVKADGKVLWAYHTDDFIKLTEDEV
jgi:hypothetical protein